MAFKSGSRIRPELGRVDYSGYTEAARINAAALQNLSNTVGSAILAHKQKQEQKELDNQAASMVLEFSKGNLAANSLGINDLNTAKVAVKSLGGGRNTLDVISKLNMISREEHQADALSNAIAVNTDTEGNIDKDNVVNSALELGVSLPVIQRYLELEEMQKPVTPDKLESVNVGDFNVLLKNGKFAQAAKKPLDKTEKKPAGILRIEYMQDQLQEARQAHEAGDDKTAFNILTSIGTKSPWTGGALLQDEVADVFMAAKEPDPVPDGRPDELQIGSPNGGTRPDVVFNPEPIEIVNNPTSENEEPVYIPEVLMDNNIINVQSEDEIESIPIGRFFRYKGRVYKRK